MKTKFINKKLIGLIIASVIAVTAGVYSFYFYKDKENNKPQDNTVIKEDYSTPFYPKFEWKEDGQIYPARSGNTSAAVHFFEGVFHDNSRCFNFGGWTALTGVAQRVEIKRKSDRTERELTPQQILADEPYVEIDDPVLKESFAEKDEFDNYINNYVKENGFRENIWEIEKDNPLAVYGIQKLNNYKGTDENEISKKREYMKRYFFREKDGKIQMLEVYRNNSNYSVNIETDKKITFTNNYAIFISDFFSLEEIAKKAKEIDFNCN